MLNKVKLALRINNNAYDNEISDLISACKKELELAGIASSNIVDTDEMIIQAVIYYCKANFGYDNPDAERYIKSYESLKAFLCLNYNIEIPHDAPEQVTAEESNQSSQNSEEGE